MDRAPLSLPSVFLILAALATNPAAGADPNHQWGQWRGPLWTGVAPHGKPPVEWSEDRNVRFKIPLEGRGLASPVVWGDRLFLLTAVAADEAADAASRQAAQEALDQQQWPPAVKPVPQAYQVIAYSRHDGRQIWRRTAIEKVPHESHYLDASWASASPATDGEVLIAHFGSAGTYAYDLDGQQLWSVDLGDMTTRAGFGEGSSPVLWGDVVVINWDHEGDSFLVVLDKRTGEERWRVSRDEVTSWSTPRVVEVAGRPQVVVAATGKSRGYALADGKELWSLGGMTVNTIPTPPVVDGIAYLASGYRGTVLQAVDLARAQGEVEGSEALLWTHDRHTPYVPSLVVTGGRVFFVKHLRNIFSALDARTGEQLWSERLPGITNVYASPVAADGRLYVVDKQGRAVVFVAGPELEVLAENALDDGFDASPAIAGDTLYLRGRQYLYALAAEAEAKPAGAADSASP